VRYLEAEDRAEVFVRHLFEEDIVDLGEVRLNYAPAGDPRRPALLLIPGQSSDLVRFIDLVIRRPVIAAGHSSGGTVAAWLSAR
jgi:hypothetical protein